MNRGYGGSDYAIYFRAITGVQFEFEEYQWFRMDLNNQGNPWPVAIGDKLVCGGYAKPLVVGSEIYNLGGLPTDMVSRWDLDDESENRDVFRLDIQNPEKGWQKGPCMIIGGSICHRAAALCGKIYVFDCLNTGHSFGEVYDPKLAKWDPLPDDCSFPNGLGDENYPSFVFSDPSNDRLICLFYVGMYAYYPNSNSWECICSGSFNCRTLSMVLLDGEQVILYPIDNKYGLTESLVAFDLDCEDFIEVVWPSYIDPRLIELYERRRQWDAVVHLGYGNICVVKIKGDMINFINFHVYKQPEVNKLCLVQRSIISTNCPFKVSGFLPAAALS